MLWTYDYKPITLIVYAKAPNVLELFNCLYILCTTFVNVIIWRPLDYYANIDYASSDNKYETFFTQFETKTLIIKCLDSFQVSSYFSSLIFKSIYMARTLSIVTVASFCLQHVSMSLLDCISKSALVLWQWNENPYDFAMHNVLHLCRKIDMSSLALVIIACVNSPIQLEGIWKPMPFLRQEWTSNIIVCNHFIIFICNYCLLSSTFLFLKFIFSSALLSAIGSVDLFVTLHIVQGL